MVVISRRECDYCGQDLDTAMSIPNVIFNEEIPLIKIGKATLESKTIIEKSQVTISAHFPAAQDVCIDCRKRFLHNVKDKLVSMLEDKPPKPKAPGAKKKK